MRVAIIEDEQACAQELEQHVSRFGRESGLEIQCRWYPNGAEFLSTYQREWDLLLMDIEMPAMDGLTLARRVRAADPSVLIMFITKTAQYAMAGYEVSALDYLLKPVSYYAFYIKMRRAAGLLQARQPRHLVVQGNGFIRKLDVDVIQYIEVLGHTMTYHTLQGDVSSTGSRSIRELEQELACCGFARCSQCYLVNLRYVQSLEKDTVVLSGGTELKISRNRKKAFLQALLKDWGK